LIPVPTFFQENYHIVQMIWAGGSDSQVRRLSSLFDQLPASSINEIGCFRSLERSYSRLPASKSATIGNKRFITKPSRVSDNHRIIQQRQPWAAPVTNPVVWYKGFLYQAASWKTARRVVAKVEFPVGELFPRVGFIATNLSLPSLAVVRFYNKGAWPSNRSTKPSKRRIGPGYRVIDSGLMNHAYS
jgi:hypothetical protein